jgi:hypothetical protein
MGNEALRVDTCGDKPTPEIVAEVENLTKVINELSGLINTLNEKISPVCCSAEVKVQNCDEKISIRTELGGYIRKEANVIEELTSIVRSMNNRIEL